MCALTPLHMKTHHRPGLRHAYIYIYNVSKTINIFLACNKIPENNAYATIVRHGHISDAEMYDELIGYISNLLYMP